MQFIFIINKRLGFDFKEFYKLLKGVCKKQLFILLRSVVKQANFLEYYKIRKIILKKIGKIGPMFRPLRRLYPKKIKSKIIL